MVWLQIVISRKTDVLDRVFRLSCESCHDDTIDGAARCVAGLINKMPQGDELVLIRVATVASLMAK